jgi:hypothetical protein
MRCACYQAQYRNANGKFDDKTQIASILLGLSALSWACGPAAAAVRIEGQVQAGGGPVSNSTVTLCAAGFGEPRQLAQARTTGDGRFEISSQDTLRKGASSSGSSAVSRALASGSLRAWHGTDDLSSAFLTAVGYVIDLATRNKDVDFHERFASDALRRIGLKARLGFL